MHELNRRGFLGSALGGAVSTLGLGLPGWSRAEGASQEQGAALGRPDTLFLTWQRDPTTTMTVQWIAPAVEAGAPAISYSRHRQNDWRELETRARPFPTTNRSVFRAEITGLSAGTEYELRIGMEQTAFRFRTMPARATDAFHFISGGDCGVNQHAVNNSTSWSNALSVASDHVLEQYETQYDADSNAILNITRQRFHDATAPGSLIDPSNNPKARVYYAAAYYDALGRQTATVDVGTNGGSAWTRPSSVPSRSDTVLVNSATYNNAGLLDTTTDPRGIVAKNYYDALGRTVKTIADYTDGTPTSSSNQTTEYGYDGDDNTTFVQADLPSSAVQKTAYVYGVTTGGGNGVTSNDIVAAVQYPDASTGAPSSSSQVTSTVNGLGEMTTMTDRDGNVHAYGYDVLGRQISDTVTTLGSGVDGSVRRIDTAYDSEGNPYLFTSYSDTSGSTIVSQVEDIFNGLGQLTKEYQSHSGAVNTSSTPYVQYNYTEMASGVNNSRPTSIVYPNGREIDYNYASGLDNSISRLTSVSDSSGTLETLTYLGLSTVVQRTYNQPGVALSYIQQSGDSSTNTDGGDQYTGLDRFGRVIDQNWLKTSSGTNLSREQLGFDRDSNVLYSNNLVNSAFSELYHASGAGNGYDNFNQLTGFVRGTLSASTGGGPLDTVSSPAHSQGWSLDALGNWTSVTTDGTTQTRGVNQDNQITSVSGATTPVYDANGNMTTDERGYHFKYDAWNRLVEVKDASNATVATYKVDALGHRIQRTESGTTTDSYFNSGWQVIEERVSGTATVQYVWSLAGVDKLIERDRDTDNNGTLDERVYVLQGYNNNVVALVNTSGTVVERYAYDPYGQVSYLSASWGALSSGAYSMFYLFQGGQWDSATGLYDFRNRDLSPTLGRWLEQDPLGFGGGDINIYRFSGDGPTDRVDPSGELWFLLGTAIGAVVGGVRAAVRGENVLAGVAVGAVVGTVAALTGGLAAGAAAGALGTGAGATIAAGAVGGAVGAAAGNATEQLLTTGEIDPRQVVVAAGAGALTGGLLAAVPPIINGLNNLRPPGRQVALNVGGNAGAAAAPLVSVIPANVAGQLGGAFGAAAAPLILHVDAPAGVGNPGPNNGNHNECPPARTRYGNYVRRVDDFKHALDPNHVKAALIEKNGGVVSINPKNGLPYNHLLETRNAMQGALNRITLLKKYLSDPLLPADLRSSIMDELGQLSKMLDNASRILGE